MAGRPERTLSHAEMPSIQSPLGASHYFMPISVELILFPKSKSISTSPDFVIGLLVLIFATVPPPSHVVAWTLPPAKVHQLVNPSSPDSTRTRPSSSNSPSSLILLPCPTRASLSSKELLPTPSSPSKLPVIKKTLIVGHFFPLSCHTSPHFPPPHTNHVCRRDQACRGCRGQARR